MSKRKCKFKDEFEQIKDIKRSKKNDEWFRCELCGMDIKLASGGRTALTEHTDSNRHKENLKAAQSTQSLTNFFPSNSAPTLIDDKTAAAEGAWAYHLVSHHQSFASTNCVSSDGLFRTMFADSKVAVKFL